MPEPFSCLFFFKSDTIPLPGMQTFDVIVVGGGPAGLMAAGRAAETGCKVLVLEKMERAGRKLLITGKGRCNITNDAPLADFITHVYPNGRFLRHAFSQFFSGDIINLLKAQGVETILERGGRFFPSSNKSADVLNALLTWVRQLGVEIRCHHRVEKLVLENQSVKGIVVHGKLIEAKHVILATGGKSYPATGSTGDGYELAGQVGHSVEALRPSLVPLETAGKVARGLQGLSLKNVKAVVWVNGKKAGEDFGEMLFTHFGLSGPIILTLSRLVVNELRKQSKVEITVDLKPALDEKKLDNRLLRDLDEHGRKKIGNIFGNWLPSKMIPVFMELLEIDPDKEGHQISAKERKSIRKLMKSLPFTVTGTRSFREAIITAGGIPTSEISPRTMESKLVQGLFFAGELIDLDGETGGYNLQIAYSTGWLAGDSCKL
jgi:predicted Rossmann fold flavoprotein